APHVRLHIGAAVVLGQNEHIEKVALEENISLDHIGVIDPVTSSELPTFVQRLEKLKRYRDLGTAHAEEIMVNHNYFAAMMVQYGQVDAIVTGAAETASSSLRPLIELIKPLPTAQFVSSCMMLDL